MKTEILINGGHLQLVAQYMQSRELELSDVFTPDQLVVIAHAQTTGQAVPVLQFAAMMRQLATHLQEPDITLKIASMIRTGHLGVVGYLLHTCANAAEALACLRRYRKLIVTAVEDMKVLVQQDTIELRWEHNPTIDPLVLELGIAIMVQFSQQLVNQHLAPTRVNLIQVPPSIEPYEKYYGCPVHFHHGWASVVFPATYLSLPISQPDKTLQDILQQQADMALQALPKTDEFMKRVHQLLARQCQDGQPHVEELAAQLHLSIRTVQRRLVDSGTTFQQALDEVRQQLCWQYLQQDIQLSDIAQLLGYSDQSAFTRAYKRWTGSTPHQERLRGKPV